MLPTPGPRLGGGCGDTDRIAAGEDPRHPLRGDHNPERHRRAEPGLGTAFWSQRYRNFDEVGPPRIAPTFPNPTQQLDFARFSDHELRACYRAGCEVLRAAPPAVPVTTNVMGLLGPTDGWAWADEMDLVSVDRYPTPARYLVSDRAPADVTAYVDSGGTAAYCLATSPDAATLSTLVSHQDRLGGSVLSHSVTLAPGEVPVLAPPEAPPPSPDPSARRAR